MEYLGHLNLRGTPITGKHFHRLAKLNDLSNLDISECPLTDKAWHALAHPVDLRLLSYEDGVLTAESARLGEVPGVGVSVADGDEHLAGSARDPFEFEAAGADASDQALKPGIS